MTVTDSASDKNGANENGADDIAGDAGKKAVTANGANGLNQSMNPSRDDFEALLNESFGESDNIEGEVVEGVVVGLEKDLVVIDVGLKTEGRVPLKEFAVAGKEPEINIGDKVEVYVERIENALGEAVLSHEKARREESWKRLEKQFEAGEKVEGVIFSKVKGGFMVDLDGAAAFLPGSQVDVRPIRDITPLMNQPQPFEILKMDKRRGNIVVSRRSVLEETKAEQRSEVVARLEEGQVIEGVVKNITDYGAFIDLGGIDGLLHVTDMAWRRVNHPSEIISVGDNVKVQILRINPENQRVSLGIKQLDEDPWKGVEKRYPVGSRIMGKVTNITDYGAFIELQDGVEGLVHISEMSWVRKNIHPGKLVSTSQELEVEVLSVDPDKRRISLGIKQCQDNPWDSFADKYPKGAVIEGQIRNITEFGMFIGLDGHIDGMVHLSDLDWNRPGDEVIREYRKGDMVKAVVLDVDPGKERISLGIKQLEGDPYEAVSSIKRGDTVTCEVTEIKDGGLDVRIADTEVPAFIRRGDLSRERSEQRPERFNVGDKLDAIVSSIDKGGRRINLSIKALEIREEKKAVEEYGSTDSGASLGDILGAALKGREGDEDKEPGKDKE
jgi:small subunit ribosomal protein S1